MDMESLRTIRLFTGLSEPALDELSRFAHERTASAGTVLLSEGDLVHSLWGLTVGSASAFRGDKRVAALEAGDVFGEDGVLERGRSKISVIADSDVQLVGLTHWDFKRVARRAPAVGVLLRAGLDGLASGELR